MKLESLKPALGAVKSSKRIGRGTGSGKGGTSTRGHKGAKSRSGYSSKVGFEGGQMPLYRRLPKFGFNNPNRQEYKSLNLDAVQSFLDTNKIEKFDFATMLENGLVAKNDKVKILARGVLKSKIEIYAHAFSESAIKAIESAGGKAIKI
jgi:large subunit ribosomal protein L15